MLVKIIRAPVDKAEEEVNKILTTLHPAAKITHTNVVAAETQGQPFLVVTIWLA